MYGNDKLKPVYFHGNMVYPLYIRVGFDRNNTIFKSYYFDLFSKTKYTRAAAGLIGGPTVDKVEKMEDGLIRFIVNRLGEEFTLEKFKEAYSYYGLDLCQELEEGFNHYLHTFFQDKGLPSLATVSAAGSKVNNPFDLLRDFKRSLQKPLYDELVNNAMYYAPPYLPVYGFISTFKKWPMQSFTVKEWEAGELEEPFSHFLETHYSPEYGKEVRRQISRLLEHLKNRKK